MSTPNGSGGHYRVVYSGVVRTALGDLLREALQQGILAEIEAAAMEIDGHLPTHPTLFGEPLYDLHQTGLQARTGAVGRLVVSYAVDEARRLVYVVLPFQLLPGAGP